MKTPKLSPQVQVVHMDDRPVLSEFYFICKILSADK